jgi:prevent-host-death family protein
MTVVSSRDFNRDVSRAKRAARLAPVFVTDRGKPTHVLMSIDAYRRLAGQAESIVDLLAVPDEIDIDPEDARVPAIRNAGERR